MQQNRNDVDTPNRQSNMEKAEGSRPEERDEPELSDRERQGGITNRGRDREREEQQRLPGRGHSKSENSR